MLWVDRQITDDGIYSCIEVGNTMLMDARPRPWNGILTGGRRVEVLLAEPERRSFGERRISKYTNSELLTRTAENRMDIRLRPIVSKTELPIWIVSDGDSVNGFSFEGIARLINTTLFELPFHKALKQRMGSLFSNVRQQLSDRLPVGVPRLQKSERAGDEGILNDTKLQPGNSMPVTLKINEQRICGILQLNDYNALEQSKTFNARIHLPMDNARLPSELDLLGEVIWQRGEEKLTISMSLGTFIVRN